MSAQLQNLTCHPGKDTIRNFAPLVSMASPLSLSLISLERQGVPVQLLTDLLMEIELTASRMSELLNFPLALHPVKVQCCSKPEIHANAS